MHNDPKEKNDRLIQFIDQHQDSFEEDFSSDKVWNKIEATISTPHKSFKQRYLPILTKVAAAIILMIAGAGIWGLINSKSQVTDIELKVANQYNPEYADQIIKFTGLVEQRQEELKKISYSAPNFYQNFSKDLDELENVYTNLKSNLYNNPNREDLLIALIENLEMQADVLNQQLAVIKNLKQRSHEKQ